MLSSSSLETEETKQEVPEQPRNTSQVIKSESINVKQVTKSDPCKVTQVTNSESSKVTRVTKDDSSNIAQNVNGESVERQSTGDQAAVRPNSSSAETSKSNHSKNFINSIKSFFSR